MLEHVKFSDISKQSSSWMMMEQGKKFLIYIHSWISKNHDFIMISCYIVAKINSCLFSGYVKDMPIQNLLLFFKIFYEIVKCMLLYFKENSSETCVQLTPENCIFWYIFSMAFLIYLPSDCCKKTLLSQKATVNEKAAN